MDSFQKLQFLKKEAAFLEKAIKWLEGQCIRRNGKIALISIDEFKKAMEK